MIFLGFAHPVDRDVVAEDHPSGAVCTFNRRAGEPDARRVRQRECDVLSKRRVLRPVRLIGHHDDVLALGEHRHLLALGGRRELLDRREHNATRGDLQQLVQAFRATRDLCRLVAGSLQVCARERFQKLGIEIRPVGQRNDGWVCKTRITTQLVHEENHRVALAGALRVPHQPATTIVRHRGGHRLHGGVHGVNLVILGHHLPRPSAVGLKQQEVVTI